LGGTKKDITLLVLSGISLIISIFDVIPGLPVDAAWIAIILCGIPIILEAVIGLVTEFDIKADVLVSLALIAAIIIHEDFAAGEVAFIMQLGGLLEDLTVEKARAGIEKLVQLTPRTARVITLNGGRETENVIPAEAVKVDDILRVLPGETIPVDGVIVSGVIPVLLTGDNEYAAKTIADKLNIKDVRWNCMPEDKLDYIKKSQQDHKENICMAGDGINDAPALKMAHVGIAMGGIGSDIAIDAADITLINDDIKELPHLLGLSKRMMTVIKLNLTFSMSLNFIAIILAISGVLNPVAGALVHNCGSVVVIINSAFLLKWKHKK
jgi:cation transport ATPase